MTSARAQTVKMPELSQGIWRCGSVVEYLPNMHEALSSIVSNIHTHTHAHAHAHMHARKHTYLHMHACMHTQLSEVPHALPETYPLLLFLPCES